MRIHLAMLLLAGCAFGSQSIDEVDPGAIPQNPTYSQDVAPIIDYYCLGCHDPATPFNEEPPLDNLGAVIDEYDGIIEEVFGARTMPPGGAPQLTPREGEIIKRWGQQDFTP